MNSLLSWNMRWWMPEDIFFFVALFLVVFFFAFGIAVVVVKSLRETIAEFGGQSEDEF
jgi:hypothetical protein